MPAPAQAPPKPELPPTKVLVAGKQEAFQEKGFTLAAALGWRGEPHFVTVGIRVDDAQNYCTKLLHEQFQAGARGDAQPDYLEACLHLGVDTEVEQDLIDEATSAAYEAGKGADLEVVDRTIASVGASLILPLSKAEESAGKAG